MGRQLVLVLLALALSLGAAQAVSANTYADRIVAFKAVDFVNQGDGDVQFPTDRAYPTFSHWDYQGHWLEWKVTIPEEGIYIPAAMYGTNREYAYRQLSIDGEFILEMVFHSTGDFRTYKLSYFDPVQLPAGEHVIRIAVAGDAGVHQGVNPAWFAFIPAEVWLELDDAAVIKNIETMLGFIM
ncbi:MAG: hypothetical protein GX228_03125 [Firmicutes bacterium]|jgi:hypothetical protein|nr:hypothetical protein [Bacillota bacterium]NLL87912.1 hypothetical protein [Bacillota bacterium]HKM18108.1 hypothetical protein [Limnochordia bacterium]